MKHIKIIIFSALTVALSGCLGSFLEPKEDPTVFYVMRSQQDVEKVEFASPLEINMLNVIVPAYMSRNQIVVLEKSTIEISEFNRWAELPTEGIERVLQDNLAAASSKLSVYVYPQCLSIKAQLGCAYLFLIYRGIWRGHCA
ncbi:MAG: membrane integrity-associated transporter subunit PqiC [Bacilli bacterium]